MGNAYHVYANDLVGGPVDYTSIVATTAALTWTGPALSASATATYAVRAYDTVSGLEETNVDARVTVKLNAARADITGQPNAPIGLTATAKAAATARVDWHYNPGGQGGAPTGFRVYAGTPTPNYGVVAATATYQPGAATFSATLSGFVDGTTYQVGVRAFNATAEEANAVVTSFVADATGPSPVQSLTATVIA